MNWGGTSSSHVWNVFNREPLSDVNNFISASASVITYDPNSTIDETNLPPFWSSNSSFGVNI